MTGYEIYESIRTIQGGIRLVSAILGAYYGYVEGKRKEDDLAVKRKVMDEIKKSRSNLTNILSEFADRRDPKGQEAAKSVIDELDIFNTDVDLSEAGHRYPFFSIQNTANKTQIMKLIEFDKSLITTMENVAQATSMLHDKLIDGQVQAPDRELKKIKQYVTSCRNYYKDRRDFIKDIR
jgi:hypothetical protein